MSVTQTTIQTPVRNYYFQSWAQFETNKNSLPNGSNIYIDDSGSCTVILKSDSLPTANPESPDFVEVSGVLYRKKSTIVSNVTSYSYEAIQDKLTTTSVNDGTIAKNIGFDIDGNIVKETSSEIKRSVIASIILDAATNSIVINNLNIDSSKRISYHVISPGVSTTENIFIQINDITSTYIDSAAFCESDWQTPAVRLENAMYNWQTGFFVCYVKNISEKIIADGTIENLNGTLIHKNLAVCIGDTNVPSTYRNNAGFLKNSTITSINKINIFTNNANFNVGTKVLIYTEDI